MALRLISVIYMFAVIQGSFSFNFFGFKREDNSILADDEIAEDITTISSLTNTTELPVTATTRRGKLLPFLPFLSVVDFTNAACRAAGDSPRLGTCHTKKDCMKLGGKMSGTCAYGYGVCCVAARTCGETSYLNNTYFISPEPGTNVNFQQNSGQPSIRQCQMTVKKFRPDICQMKLEFEAFQMSPPDLITQGRVGDCTNDMFVAVAGSQSSPVICGSNPGQHMYINLGSGTDSLQLTAVMSSISPRWSIRVIQIPCESNYLAPPGCLQYHTGVSGYVKSFNFDGRDHHLNNQRYSICVRGEEGFCGITWEQARDFTGISSIIGTGGNLAAQGPTTFQISSVGAAGTGGTQSFIVGSDASSSAGQSLCSGNTAQRDFVGIACGSRNGRAFSDQSLTGTGQQIPDPPVCADKFCGTLFGYASGATAPQPITSLIRPFNMYVHFDDSEALITQGSTTTGNIYEPGVGFNLLYTLRSCATTGSSLGRTLDSVTRQRIGNLSRFLDMWTSSDIL